MQYAVLFPGQGSQSVGMGADVFAARPDLLGSAADEVLGWSLADICANGPESELVRTDRAQPALYGVSYALWEAFAVRAGKPPVAAAGHSLGEYTALAASGALDYLDGLRLVAARGAAMAKAIDYAAGSMAAVMGADLETLETIVADQRALGAEIWVANINAPGQTVVAGSAASIEYLAENARDLGLRRVIPLNVAGAFHTPLMAPAGAELGEAISSIEILPGSFPVFSNLEAAPAFDVAASLSGQLTGKVRFSESLAAMVEAGAEAFVHIGPGDVTAGMAKRTAKGATIITVSSLEDIDAAVATLAAS
ncbi:MAG: ACP S-malonyltransferase [bacterium]|nr:ACP S-malonyltransferase [bacterium]